MQNIIKGIVGRTVIVALGTIGIGVLLIWFLYYYYQGTLRYFGDSRPNIVVVMSDDQRFDSMHAMPLTKEALGSKGVTFTNAFIPTPLCCPSRTSFLTGMYSHNTGIWRNNPPEGGFESFHNDASTIAVLLQKAGYKTALIGKYLNGYHKNTYVPPGWSEWYALNKGNYYNFLMNENGRNVRYGTSPEDYSGTVIKKKAVDFIRSAKGSPQPFFLVVTPNNPHGDSGNNIDDQGGARPAPNDEKNCVPQEPYRPVNFNEPDMSDKPSFIRSQKPLTEEQITAMDTFHTRQICALKSLDETIAALSKELGDEKNNTVFVFYSDNGYAYGEHRNRAKNCLYEECIHVPMIISYPKITKQEDTSSSLTAANIDVMATLLDLAGVQIPSSVDGKSLKKVLSDPSSSIREGVLLEVNSNKLNNAKNYGIRTKQYVYIENATGETELYDLIQDPFELTNLTNNPDYANTKAELAAKLATMKLE